MSSSGGGPGSREVAYRLFAAEYDDATLEHSESDEERAPNYVVTPTGARVNRLFAVGVLTEVESVSDDVLRARVVDPTGAFVVYAGQYQPEAKAFLDRAEPPTFVALTGKARTYSPDDSDRVFTSVRPESINEVDADTRDRWTIQAAEQTLDRVATLAAALDRPERGADLAAVLQGAGVSDGLSSGIPLAIEHYGTTTGYLDALRTLAIQAVEVVAGDRSEVESVEIAPDEGGEVRVDWAADLGEVEPVAADVELEASEAHEPADVPEPETVEEEPATEPAGAEETIPEAEPETIEEPATAEVETNGPGDFDDFGEPAESESDDLYEMDEAERQEVEEEFGTEFTSGSEVDEPGEAEMDLDTEPPSAGAETGEAVDEPEPEPAVDEEPEPEVEAEPDEEAAEPEPAGEPEDLEDAVVEVMRDLDEGDGADRDAVINEVSDAHNVPEDEVADAIDDALMSGQCYEPADGKLKAI